METFYILLITSSLYIHKKEEQLSVENKCYFKWACASFYAQLETTLFLCYYYSIPSLKKIITQYFSLIILKIESYLRAKEKTKQRKNTRYYKIGISDILFHTWSFPASILITKTWLWDVIADELNLNTSILVEILTPNNHMQIKSCLSLLSKLAETCIKHGKGKSFELFSPQLRASQI